MAFDPCREWLGIDAVHLGDPARVLGLPPGSEDAASISRAAEARLRALHGVSPGPFAKAHAAILARVEEARDTLLANALLNEPTPPVAPSPVFPAPPPLHDDGPSLSPPSSAEANLASAPPSAIDAFAGESFSPTSGRRRAVSRRRASSHGGGFLVALAALLIAGGLVLAFLMIRPDLNGQSGRQVAAKQPQLPAKPSTNAVEPDQPKPATPGPDAAEMEARKKENRMQQEARQREAVQQEARQRADRENEAAAEVTPAAVENTENEAEAQAREAQEKIRQEEIDGEIRKAYQALQREEFDSAERAITAAGKQVGDDVKAATRIERWRLLATYAKEFVGFRKKAFASANEGRQYSADDKIFSVIEVTPQQLVYKIAGEIKRVPRDNVDPRIEMAIVEGWFAADGRAANHLFLGAHWLCLDPPDPKQARREWQVAGDGGEEVSPLLALLEDPVVRQAGR